MLLNSWNGKNASISKRKHRFIIEIRFILENFPQQIESLIFIFLFIHCYIFFIFTAHTALSLQIIYNLVDFS